jgi:hypothetical protein
MMNYRPFIKTKLARQGPAAYVVPVLIPRYI